MKATKEKELDHMWEAPKLKKPLVIQIEQSKLSMDSMTQACLHRDTNPSVHTRNYRPQADASGGVTRAHTGKEECLVLIVHATLL